MSALQPPRLDTGQAVAHEGSDHSDDHFSSASEGSHSPIPTTRVERVDDEARHGEVPGTPAYTLRMQDAVPDEIEVVPEGRRSRSNTTSSQNRGRGLSSASASGSRSNTPGGSPIPKTVVEKVDFKPSYGEVEGTPAKEMRMADAMPDEVRTAPVAARQSFEGRDEGERGQEVDGEDDEDEGWLRSSWQERADERGAALQQTEIEDEDEAEDDDFGDDFDEFAEGEEHEDFGDFDEPQKETPPPSKPPAPDILAGLPPLDLSTCTTSIEIQEAIAPYINAILPHSSPLPPKSSLPPLDPSQLSPFQSDRSLSLWQQLVSPPPMQPPNWTKSRIRRLFLVSLGVPIDLDEILPPSKQKRLVLPSIGLEGEEGAKLPRPSTSAIERLREQQGPDADNESSTSLDSKTGKPKASSKAKSAKRSRPPTSTGAANKPGVAPPPDFDTNAASLLCSTTEAALSVYSDAELKEHVFTLQMLNEKASKVLEYWLQRKDEGLKEKEALEGVIENLVGFVKGRRGR